MSRDVRHTARDHPYDRKLSVGDAADTGRMTHNSPHTLMVQLLQSCTAGHGGRCMIWVEHIFDDWCRAQDLKILKSFEEAHCLPKDIE